MTNHAFFLSTSLALLLTLENQDSKNPLPLKKGFRFYTEAGLRLLACTGLVSTLYFLSVELWFPSSSKQEPAILFFLVGAYIFGRAKKQTDGFIMTCFALTSFVFFRELQFSFAYRLTVLCLLILHLTIFRTLLAGLRERLIFSPVPKKFAGYPILFFTAAILALAFSAFTPNPF